jgi:hypothetical protein
MPDPARWQSKFNERKCSCDDDPTELGQEREHCLLHDGPMYDDLDPWGDPRG